MHTLSLTHTHTPAVSLHPQTCCPGIPEHGLSQTHPTQNRGVVPVCACVCVSLCVCLYLIRANAIRVCYLTLVLMRADKHLSIVYFFIFTFSSLLYFFISASFKLASIETSVCSLKNHAFVNQNITHVYCLPTCSVGDVGPGLLMPSKPVCVFVFVCVCL